VNVFLTTLGCRLNEAEISHWGRAFESRGHTVVRVPQAAQIMVINTCAVTSEAARKSRKFINGLHRLNPDARLVVTGCYSELEPSVAASLAGVDLVVGNKAKDLLVDEVIDNIDVDSMPVLAEQPDSSHVYREARTRAFIKVQDGCRNRCTFCIVTIARGDERSSSIEDLVTEVNALATNGYREAVLTGVHLGGYGRDIGTDLYTLVDTLLRETNIPRIRLSSLEPWDLPEGFAKLWSDPRLMPHLHLPLQSGSDSVLKRMARRCSVDSFGELVSSFRATIPGVTITTDLIVGFPGETDEEWAETMSTVQRIRFAHMHIFSYSRREGTTAARMPGHLSKNVRRARSREMHALASRMKREHLERFVGTTRDVLWEGSGEPTLEPSGTRFFGYTDNYLRVATIVPTSTDLKNRITGAKLARIADDGHHFAAEVATSDLAAAAVAQVC